MLAILGPSAKDLISSGDPVADRNKQDTFSLNYIGLHQFAAASDGRTFLYIGPNNAGPTPIPLLRKNASIPMVFRFRLRPSGKSCIGVSAPGRTN